MHISCIYIYTHVYTAVSSPRYDVCREPSSSALSGPCVPDRGVGLTRCINLADLSSRIGPILRTNWTGEIYRLSREFLFLFSIAWKFDEEESIFLEILI